MDLHPSSYEVVIDKEVIEQVDSFLAAIISFASLYWIFDIQFQKKEFNLLEFMQLSGYPYLDFNIDTDEKSIISAAAGNLSVSLWYT